MAGLGSAALAAAKLFGGIERGKLAGSQRAREEATQRKEAEDAEQRARLDEMVKMSTVGRNKAETDEQLRATSVAPKTFKELLEREAAGRNPPAPRNIDPLSPEGITAGAERAGKVAGATAPYQRSSQPRADPADAETRASERERRAYIAKTTREYMAGDPRADRPALKFSEAKVKAEQEAAEIYGAPKATGGQPSPGVDVRGEEPPPNDDIVQEAAQRIREGKGTLEQAKEALSPSSYRALERLMGRKAGPPPLRGPDRF